MKKTSLVLLVLFLSTPAMAQGVKLGGKNSFWSKPLGHGSGSVKQEGGTVINQTVEVVDKALETTATGVGKVLGAAKEGTDELIHNTGKTFGDGVKNLRNSIAMMQGVNVDKSLKELRSQISSCRNDKAKLNGMTRDLRSLNRDLKKRLIPNPNISSSEIIKMAEGMLNNLEHFKNGAGTAMGLGLTSWQIGSLYAANSTGAAASVGSWAGTGGVYTAVAAAAVLAMMSSVTTEIEHEQDKLKKCGKEYETSYADYETASAQYVAIVEKDKTKADRLNELNQGLAALMKSQLACELDTQCGQKSSLPLQKRELIAKVRTFQADYPDYKKEMLDAMIEQVENLEEL